MNHTGNHRLRKLSDSLHKSPQRGESGSESDNNRKVNPVCEARSKIGHSSGFSPDHRTGKSERKFIDGSDVLVDFNSDKKVDPSDARSKIYIRFPAKNDKSVDEVADVGDQSLITEDIEELVPKTWTLRPRKPICKPSNHNGSSLKIGASAHENKTHRSEATRSRNVTEPKVAEKKDKKQKFSVSLSREEIDDDIFAMTGSKASRRPKKRAKSVQKQLDCVFPGLWLASITPDCYRVTEAPVKKQTNNAIWHCRLVNEAHYVKGNIILSSHKNGIADCCEAPADDIPQTGQLLERCTVTQRDGFGGSSNEPAVASMSTSEKASPSVPRTVEPQVL
ncbi:hypothetical protein GOBAR_AA38097 [Gossypium barbadense]|uniref:Uncharacterized protein n=1 Tax=Gossypium barbadense TaxID=3634 RepID=A0A2P5VUV0_GOSBA|nr:hypothetical protein GOBAR_AA38097 [Gossypium barbadense]